MRPLASVSIQFTRSRSVWTIAMRGKSDVPPW
jgi:hypothetical protein